MSSTIDATLPAQVDVEILGVTLMRYLSVMGMVLVHYDFLLTLDDEVCLIFASAFHIPHTLFRRCASCGRGRFSCQKPCTTSIAMYPSLE
jgi:hypothetical protein